MDESTWRQVTLSYPSPDRQQRESHAVAHLSGVLPASEATGLITSWWFIRKGAWRVRYRIADGRNDLVHPLLTDGHSGISGWTDDTYEPEVHAFGGPAGMDTAHRLFHLDSRHLLNFLGGKPDGRRERSLVLCTALMRSAGLDLNEQGDVWARVAEHRAGLPQPSTPEPEAWASFTRDVRHILLGTARPDTGACEWLAAFEGAGRELRALREKGGLTRGVRALIALHIIFHWNRLGLGATTQDTLARAAKEAVFGGVEGGPVRP